MSDSVFKLGVLKLGCIGAAPLLDLLLDERADREDLETRAFTCGAKLDSASCSASTDAILSYRPQIILLVRCSARHMPQAARRAARFVWMPNPPNPGRNPQAHSRKLPI